MEILEGIYVQAQGDRLLLVATDLEMGIECYVPARVTREGAAVLSTVRCLARSCANWAADEVAYRTDEGGVAQISSGRSEFSINTMVRGRFSRASRNRRGRDARHQPGRLRRHIRHTSFAAAADDSRPFFDRCLFGGGRGRNPSGRHRFQPAWLFVRENSSRRQTSLVRASYRCGASRN